jgi:hypothetical protein
MKNQSKFLSATQFLVASGFLFGGLLMFTVALGFRGLKNDFLAENWEAPLVILLTLLFGVGWCLEILVERLMLNKGREVALLVLIGTVILYALIGLGSLLFLSLGFWRYVLLASDNIFVGGFFFRFSAMSPELAGRFRKRD